MRFEPALGDGYNHHENTLANRRALRARRVQWAPVVDGVALPDEPRALAAAGALTNDVPLIAGTCRDELFPCEARHAMPYHIRL